MSEIICPVCGTANADTSEKCQHCGTELKKPPQDSQTPARGKISSDPLADLLAGLAKQEEPEEEIPAWLKSLQSSIASNPPAEEPKGTEPAAGQEQAPEEPVAPAEQPGFGVEPAVFKFDYEPEPSQPSESPDWLKALKGQEEQSTPTPPVVKNEQPAPEDFSGWLAGLAGTTPEITPEDAAQLPADNPEAPDWLSSLGGDFTAAETAAPENSAIISGDDTPDWLSALGGLEEAPAESVPEQPAGPAPVPTPANEMPDWLAALGKPEEAPAEPVPEQPAGPAPVPAPANEMPDWLAALGKPEEAPAEPVPEQPAGPAPIPTPASEMPDWLATLERPAEPSAEPVPDQPTGPAPITTPSGDVPDWLAALQTPEPAQSGPEAEPSAEEISAPTPSGDVPDWLAALQTPESAQSGPEAEPPTAETPAPAPASEMPDWLAALSQFNPPASRVTRAEAGPAAEKSFETAQEPETIQPADVAGAAGETTPAVESAGPEMEAASGIKPESLPETPSEVEALIPHQAGEQNIDSILSMETPGWLSGLAGSEQAQEKEALQAAESPARENLPEEGELPSWVQAMRPVESVIEGTHNEEESQEVEAQGPLAGLSSVLPIQAGLSGTRKPGAYSIKLQANETQQAQAALLEELLHSENIPHAVAKGTEKLVSRPLRWVIAALLLLGILAMAALRPGIFPAPAQPAESSPVGLFRKTVDELPNGAPVMLVLDYQAGFAGELEAATAPVVEHLMSKGAHLAFVSTSPLGGLLAERLVQKYSVIYPYQAGAQYVNLGYLPGGANGIRAFADRPAAILGQDSLLGNLWKSPALAEIVTSGEPRLSNFAALIVATDNPDTGRTWIEQTQPALASTPMLMVVSAQAEPMIHPYLLSNQLKGLVAGLEGGLLYESAQGKTGDAHTNWEAFSTGVLIAVLIIVLGGAWSLFMGLRARRKPIEQDEA